MSGIRHNFISGRPDNDDPGDIQPSHWNDEHFVDGMVGALLALAATPNGVPYIDVNGAAQTFLISAFVRSFMNVASDLAFRNAIGAAPLSSPAFTGFPTTPTTAASDNSTKIASTAFVQAVVANLINSAPGALDTLNELAAALGNDPNFATTMTNALAAKAPLASPALTGTPTAPTVAGSTDSTTKIATTAFVQACILALAQVARTGAYSDLTGKPTLGTAAALNVGTAANQIVQLDGTARLPAVDASQLTKVTLSSGVASLAANVSLGAINTLTSVLTTPALAAGTYMVMARASFRDNVGAAQFVARLFDGTSILGSSGVVQTQAANGHVQAVVEAIVSVAAGVSISLQAFDGTSGNGFAVSNDSGGHGPDTYMSWVRIAS
jgi:hypothetical protein